MSDSIILGPDSPEQFATDWTDWNRNRKRWHTRFSRGLTSEERADALHEIEEHNYPYEEAQGGMSMVKTLWVIAKYAPDVEVIAWWHEAFFITVQGLYLPYKIYEIVGAMSADDATETARNKWKEQYGHHGVRATISETRIATKKDVRKAREVR